MAGLRVSACARRWRCGADRRWRISRMRAFAQAGAIARLEEERLAALEDRIDADLAIGEQAGLVGELEGLVTSIRGGSDEGQTDCSPCIAAGRRADALGGLAGRAWSLVTEEPDSNRVRPAELEQGDPGAKPRTEQRHRRGNRHSRRPPPRAVAR